MNIILNGNPLEIDENTSATALLLAHGYDGKLVAVALNGTFLPKGKYGETLLQQGDKIEIVAPMQGG